MPYEKEKRNSNSFFINMYIWGKRRKIWICFLLIRRKMKKKRKFKSVLHQHNNMKNECQIRFQCLRKTKNKNLRWIPFSCATEKQLALRYTSSCGSDTIISGIISTVPCCKLSNDQKNSPFLILPKKKLKRIKTFYPYWHFLQFQSPLKRWSVKLTINPAYVRLPYEIYCT